MLESPSLFRALCCWLLLPRGDSSPKTTVKTVVTRSVFPPFPLGAMLGYGTT